MVGINVIKINNDSNSVICDWHQNLYKNSKLVLPAYIVSSIIKGGREVVVTERS
jgi:hypothetical protein